MPSIVKLILSELVTGLSKGSKERLAREVLARVLVSNLLCFHHILL